jgi:hypothetical protein
MTILTLRNERHGMETTIESHNTYDIPDGLGAQVSQRAMAEAQRRLCSCFSCRLATHGTDEAGNVYRLQPAAY